MITLLQIPGSCCDVETVAFLDDFLDLNSLLGRSMILGSIHGYSRCAQGLTCE